jgi:rubredoxin
LSQTTINIELGPNLPEVVNSPIQSLDEDFPCPVCGQVCPNNAYCINCGYIYDPLLKKYLKRDQKLNGKKSEKKNKLVENRNPDGSFNDLPGGHSQKYMLMVKMGKEFKRQNGRAPKTGDILRKKNQDGSYNKGSMWHILTLHGWKRSPSKKRKPTESQIRRVCQNSKRK